MSRLPNVGETPWGAILNDFLGVGHNADGSIKNVAPVAIKTTTYTIVATDGLILADATGGAFTVTLPTAVGNAGQQFIVKRISTGANVLTIATTGAQTIDGAATYLPVAWEAVPLTSDGANWVIA